MRQDLTIGPEQFELKAAHAFAAPLQHRGEPLRQPLGRGQHVLLARDRLGEGLLGDIGRDRQQRLQGLALAPQRAVELAQQVTAEAGGERRARHVENIADALEADAAQARRGLLRDTQSLQRQRRERRALATGRD